MGLSPDLSAAVDVYSDWIDACDAVAKDGEKPAGHSAPTRGPGAHTAEREEIPIMDDDEEY